MHLRFAFQSLPAGRESPQSHPPEALHARLAAISKRVCVWEKGFCWPTAPALFASEEFKLLEKGVYAPARKYAHTYTNKITQWEFQSPVTWGNTFFLIFSSSRFKKKSNYCWIQSHSHHSNLQSNLNCAFYCWITVECQSSNLKAR